MWPWSKKSKTRKTIERRMTRLALESLEYRQVLSAGPLSTAGLIKPTGGPAPLVAQAMPSGTQGTLTANDLRGASSSRAKPTRSPQELDSAERG